MLLVYLWQVLSVVQVFFSYGTAYRLAKTGGDNGVSLYGWLLLMSLASLIPGLGIYLWSKYRYLDREAQYNNGQSYITRQPLEQKSCSKCAKSYDYDLSSCPHCGYRP